MYLDPEHCIKGKIMFSLEAIFVELLMILSVENSVVLEKVLHHLDVISTHSPLTEPVL